MECLGLLMRKTSYFIVEIRKYLKETLKYLLRSYPIISPYIKEVDKLYNMSSEDLKKRNEERFLKIFRRAYDKSPFYHKLYTEAGIKKEDITCLKDIKKLPIITKDMVKQHADEILTVPRWRVVKACTSGTTGTPLKIYKNWTVIWMGQAYLYCARLRQGFRYGQPFVSLRGNLDKNQLFLKVHVSNTLYLSSYNINLANLHLYCELIKKHSPIAIEGYPSSLYSLALLLRDNNLKLNIPIAFTSSETLLPHQRYLIEQQFACELFDLYGMTEDVISLIEANSHEGYYEAPGYSINEYLEDGELCTSLINDAFPLIRYRANDVIKLAKGDKHYGNQTIVVKQVEGRKEDYILCRDGSKVMRLDFLFKGVKHVKMSQLVQMEDGTLHVHIVPENGFCENDKIAIEQNMLNRIGENNINYQIELITEQEILYTKRGKFKFVVNQKTLGIG